MKERTEMQENVIETSMFVSVFILEHMYKTYRIFVLYKADMKSL